MRETWDDVAVDGDSAEVEPAMRLHHGTAGTGDRVVVLVYRTFPTDAARNREELERDGRAGLPVLALAGAHSAFAAFTAAMMREVASDVTSRTISWANHWMPEENAGELADRITEFVGSAG
jgi:pimeloyl-ACP methyl ester carboxylesterase